MVGLRLPLRLGDGLYPRHCNSFAGLRLYGYKFYSG